MPDIPSKKHVPHPGKLPPAPPHGSENLPGKISEEYAELQVTTNYSFLTGAGHPEEYVHRAAALGYRGIAVTDRNSLAGIVRAHVAAKAAGLPFAVGSRLEMDANGLTVPLLVYPTDRASYGRLCQLLTIGKRRAPKGQCHLIINDLIEHQRGLLMVLIPPAIVTEAFIEVAEGLRTLAGDRLSLAVSCQYGPDDRHPLDQWMTLADHLRIPQVATNDVRYPTPDRKALYDVLICIREGCTLDGAGYRLSPNAEQYLKHPSEMHRLFAACPQALRRGVEILQQASAFSLDSLRYEYPHETCPLGRTPMQYLRELTWAGAAKRYPDGVPDKVRAMIEHELNLIEDLDYPHYFLTVYDIAAFARSRKILHQGRGAAANSAVCYCLQITAVDPARINLLFERFVSRERDEPPDIDIDFEHERREEVIQYLYNKYGRSRAALTAEVITYRARSAVREVGKALGLSLDMVDRLAKNLFWFDRKIDSDQRFRELGIDPRDPTIQLLVELSTQILGFPRHLSQHVGGFVLTEQPLSETVPIENAAMPDRTVIEWDKDDIDALGMLKVDVLGLGMLTCVRKCMEMIERWDGRRYEMHTIPPEDPAVYDMISNADTVGVFQVESRAQMSMLPRLRPREFYDLVIEVAIVRPGPIQGGMVHPYLRRRNGEEAITYPSEAVRDVLGKTLGVPLFQEQAMQLAIKAAGFTPGEADQLRRAMAAWKRKGDLIHRFGERLITGMVARGYERDFAERCFEQIKGFSEYGFPESHAASFALIVYVSAWLKRHHPAAFTASLLNSQPMGFYAPAQLIRDAESHGVQIRPIDVNHSTWDCTLERSAAGGEPVLRLGMRMVRGLSRKDGDCVAEAVVRHGAFASIAALRRHSAAGRRGLLALASADAFGSMGLDRQQAIWTLRALRDEDAPLFDEVKDDLPETSTSLPTIPLPRKVAHDYQAIGLSLKAHPISFLRPQLDEWHVTPNIALADAARLPNHAPVTVAGVVLVRQRPGTASGIVFMTLEDETGIANLIVRPKVFARFRRAAGGNVVIARGLVERQGQVVHVMVRSLFAADTLSRSVPEVAARNFH